MAEDVNNAFGINFNPTATTTTVHKTDPSNEELVSATNGEKEGKKLPENDGEMEITNYTANGTSSNSKEEDEEEHKSKVNILVDTVVDIFNRADFAFGAFFGSAKGYENENECELEEGKEGR